MNNTNDIKDFQKAYKKMQRKEKIVNAGKKALNWMSDNKEVTAVLLTTGIGAVAKGGKFAAKQINLKKQKNLKDLYCYDRSLGHYWQLKRELSNNEWVEIDRRKKNGERLADILDEMRVLR